MPITSRLLDAPALGRVLTRMASEIVERTAGHGPVVLVGIQRRGVQLADRLAPLIEQALGEPLRRGVLDITLYRDDLQAIGPRPVVQETRLPPVLDGTTVVIVDDVLFTGRTIRAALDEIADFGRPRRVLLAVLVDRGGRELPIAADVTGLAVDTTLDDHVKVLVQELDGEDAVDLVQGRSA
ncbi:MAG: bifunctional pyr operon transcriptional regulator/uracil phosphoribosyltransferase PyrR [Gemmatimonadota bacterium]